MREGTCVLHVSVQSVFILQGQSAVRSGVFTSQLSSSGTTITPVRPTTSGVAGSTYSPVKHDTLSSHPGMCVIEKEEVEGLRVPSYAPLF